jgi:hypothetical protein
METAFTLTPAAIENHDPALAKAVERTLSVDQLTYRGSGPSGRMEGVLRCNGTPVPVAYEVLIAYGYYQHSAGTACFLPGDSPGAALLLDRIDFGDKPPDRVNIQLFPDRRLLPPDAKEICGSLIILENVPVVHAREPSGNTKAAGGR